MGPQSSSPAPVERTSPSIARLDTRIEATTPQSRSTGQNSLRAASQDTARASEFVPDERASVRVNPKPQAPVATPHIPACPSSEIHHWKVVHANGSVRRYCCTLCALDIREKKGTDFWKPDFIQAPRDIRAQEYEHSPISQRASSNTIDAGRGERSNTRAAGRSSCKPLSAASSDWTLVDVEMRDESSSCAPPNIASDVISSVSLRTSLRGIGRSLGLGQPDAHVSAGSTDVTPVPASPSPTRASTILTSGPQIAPITSSPRSSEARNISFNIACSDSVAHNPKPRQPVATKNIPACRSGDHSWSIWANGTCRHYKCSCGTTVKERKSGDGERWLPYS